MSCATCSLPMTSQMPSQHSSRKAISALRSMMVTSGMQLTCWLSGGASVEPSGLFCLYTKSPSARLTARSPLTRFMDTLPPAASMRRFSSSL